LLSWILESAGTDPTYLVGGLLHWSRRSFRLGTGPWMVIEGDEYNTCFFDRGPKLLHYRPRILLLGPVEYDHADIYASLDAVLTAFRAGTAQVPRYGRVVVSTAGEHALAACRDAAAPLITVGRAPGSDLRLVATRHRPEGSSSELRWAGRRLTLELPLAGDHNADNAAMALAAAVEAGVDAEAALAALARFPGVARRLEDLGTVAGVTVVDDFAHHPTALGATIAAARHRWPGRRLVVAYEPRSLTAARRTLAPAYETALAGADVALVASPFHRGRLAESELLDRQALAEVLARHGCQAIMPGPDDDPVSALMAVLEPGDVVLGCSSGDFGRLHQRLLEALASREGHHG
jgi:UDP-N-acetylmuramate: L-alanyl-gamma-D-glutamyl-meso-diaminopimelate ligase